MALANLQLNAYPDGKAKNGISTNMIKRATAYMLLAVAIVLLTGTIGAAYQLTDTQRITALEEWRTTAEFDIDRLKFFAYTATNEALVTPTPIPPNQTEARNLNSVNVRLRSAPSLTGAILRNIPSQGSVTVCLAPSVQANNLTWLRVSTGGWVASDFLILSEQFSYGVECE